MRNEYEIPARRRALAKLSEILGKPLKFVALAATVQVHDERVPFARRAGCRLFDQIGLWLCFPLRYERQLLGRRGYTEYE